MIQKNSSKRYNMKIWIKLKRLQHIWAFLYIWIMNNSNYSPKQSYCCFEVISTIAIHKCKVPELLPMANWVVGCWWLLILISKKFREPWSGICETNPPIACHFELYIYFFTIYKTFLLQRIIRHCKWKTCANNGTYPSCLVIVPIQFWISVDSRRFIHFSPNLFQRIKQKYSWNEKKLNFHSKLNVQNQRFKFRIQCSVFMMRFDHIHQYKRIEMRSALDMLIGIDIWYVCGVRTSKAQTTWT